MTGANAAQNGPARGWLDSACRWLAIAGALILVFLALMTVISVLGRFLFNHAIDGDFEMVEVGCAMAVALFLPYCQLMNGNVIVDFVTMRAPAGFKRLLDAIGCLLLAGAAGVLAWRLSLGGFDLHRYHDQTMVLQIPTWIPYTVLVPCFALLCIVGLVTARRAWRGEIADGLGH